MQTLCSAAGLYKIEKSAASSRGIVNTSLQQRTAQIKVYSKVFLQVSAVRPLSVHICSVKVAITGTMPALQYSPSGKAKPEPHANAFQILEMLKL